MSVPALTVIALLYLLVVGYLGFRGYVATKSASDYMVAGRKVHPYIMALSYGATFISTSAIVGFGGAAAVFGMGLLWLTFLNIFVGIFIAFAFFGKRTRLIGHRLQAHTFPELLGRRFNSRFIQGFSGLIILVFMPLYAAAVLIGAARFIETTFEIDYDVAVTVFSLIIAGYVVAGGLKGVMYADALQGTVMFVGMVILVVFAYGQLGGVIPAHRNLSELPDRIEQEYHAVEHLVREAAPPGVADEALFGWFSENATLLGTTRTMADEERAAFLDDNPDVAKVGGLMAEHAAPFTNKMVVAGLERGGFRGWTHMPARGSNMFYVLVTSIIMGVGIGVLAQPQLAVRFMTVSSSRELHRAVLVGGVFILAMTGIAFVVGALSNAWFAMPENGGLVSLATVPDRNMDLVIPLFIRTGLPAWFGALFMLTLLSAAMSTLSSQFHAMGTSIGRDFFEKGVLGTDEHKSTVPITRIGIIVGIVVTVLLAYVLPPGIIAAATAIFFGLCAASFLPMLIGGLFTRRMTKAAAIASLCAGFGVSFFWLMFIQQVSGRLPAVLANLLLGKNTLLPDPVMGIHWNWVEALFVALPVSAIVAIVVSIFTQPESKEHLDHCFKGIGNNK